MFRKCYHGWDSGDWGRLETPPSHLWSKVKAFPLSWLNNLISLSLKSQCCCRWVPQLCLTLCDPMGCSTPGFPSFTISQSLLKLMFIESVMNPTISSSAAPFSSCPQSFPASVFSNELALMCYDALYWQVAYEIRKITYLRYVIYTSLYLYTRPCIGELKSICKYGNDGYLGWGMEINVCAERWYI